MRKSLLICGFLLLSLSGCKTDTPLTLGNGETWITKATTAYMNKESDAALEYYKKAIDQAINKYDIYNAIGVVYDQKKEYDKAIENYTKAIELKNNFSNAYNNRGLSYYDQKKYDLAIKDFEKAISIDPKFAECYYNRGVVYAEMKDEANSKTDFQKACELKYSAACAFKDNSQWVVKDMAPITSFDIEAKELVATPIAKRTLRITDTKNFKIDYSATYKVIFPGDDGNETEGQIVNFKTNQIDIKAPDSVMDNGTLKLKSANDEIPVTYDFWYPSVVSEPMKIFDSDYYPYLITDKNNTLHLFGVTDKKIKYKQSKNSGQTWTNPIKNNGDIEDLEVDRGILNVISDDKNVLHLVYGSNDKIKYRKSEDGGQTWVNPITTGNGSISNDSNESTNPKIALKDNIIHVVWISYIDKKNIIMYKKSTNGGISWEGGFNSSEEGQDISINIEPDGAIYAIYSSPTGIKYKKSTDQGNTWITRDLVNEEYARSPILGLDAKGSIYAFGRISYYRCFYKKSTDGGWTFKDLTSGISYLTQIYSIAFDPAGVIHIAGIKCKDDLFWREQKMIYLRSSDDGKTWVNPVTKNLGNIDINTQYAGIPSLLTTNDGILHIILENGYRKRY